MKPHIIDIIKRYTPVVRWSDEDNLWIAMFPDLLGPFSGTHGNTPQEAIAALWEMAEFYVEDELERHPDGSTIDPPSTVVSTPSAFRDTGNAHDMETLRRSYGYSQVDFARILGVSRSTYTKWATGLRKPCGAAARLLQVAESHPDALGLPSRKKAAVMA